VTALVHLRAHQAIAPVLGARLRYDDMELAALRCTVDSPSEKLMLNCKSFLLPLNLRLVGEFRESF
jgi:hypothetical protein